MVVFKTPSDAHCNITGLTVVYSLSSFVMLSVDNTLSCWFTLSSLWEVFFLENGVLLVSWWVASIMVTWHSVQHWLSHQQALNQVCPNLDDQQVDFLRNTSQTGLLFNTQQYDKCQYNIYCFCCHGLPLIYSRLLGDNIAPLFLSCPA
jgi:hypothetical protein